jgi:hypothetical protein
MRKFSYVTTVKWRIKSRMWDEGYKKFVRTLCGENPMDAREREEYLILKNSS